MKILALIFGSAALIATGSNGYAANAVVTAQPESVENVKVCDAYGAGFFYIPGTETCLKIGGMVRYEIGVIMHDDATHTSTARLEAETRNDSEWGTVYSWLRLESIHRDNLRFQREGTLNLASDGTADLTAYYYFGIGGLEMGYYDNPWTRFMGDRGRTDHAKEYDRQTAQYISYTADFGAFKAWVSLEPVAYDDRLYSPDISAAVSGTFGNFQAHLGVGYDESLDSTAVKAIVRGDIGRFGFTVVGLYADNYDNRYFSYEGFSGILGLSASVSDSITLASDFQYWDNKEWRLTGDVAWSVTPGFTVLLEGYHQKLNGFGWIPDSKIEAVLLRFERSF